MLSICRGDIVNNLNEIIDELELDPKKKLMLKRRFVAQVELYNKKSKVAEFFYIFFSIFVTIGSIILPALLSIQQLDYSEDDSVDEEYREKVYWTTWGLSLLVSIFNGLLQLFSLGKQYVSYNQTREKMISEAWQYFTLSGDYQDSTHEESFNEFCEEIEKIKDNQIEKDFMFINPKAGKKKQPKSDSSSSGSIRSFSPQVINHKQNIYESKNPRMESLAGGNSMGKINEENELLLTVTDHKINETNKLPKLPKKDKKKQGTI
jgi:hypothetical protein